MRKALMMFGILNDADIDWLSKVGDRARFPPGAPLIVEHKPIDAIFIILDGRARVTLNGTALAHVDAGEILGEISLVNSRLPTASVVAENEVTVLRIGRTELTVKLKTDAQFGCRFYHALSVALAQRLQERTAGTSGPGALPDSEAESDDVEDNLLEAMSLAGIHFDQLRKRMLKGL